MSIRYEEQIGSPNGNHVSTGADIDPIYRDYVQVTEALMIGELVHQEFQQALESVAYDNEDAVTGVLLAQMATTESPVVEQGAETDRNIGSLFLVGEPAGGKTTLMDGAFRAFGYRPNEVAKVPLNVAAHRLTGTSYQEITESSDGTTQTRRIVIPGVIGQNHKALRLDELNRQMREDAVTQMLEILDNGYMVTDEAVIVLGGLNLAISTANPSEISQGTRKLPHALLSRMDVGVAMNEMSDKNSQKLAKHRVNLSSIKQVVDDETIQILRGGVKTELLSDDMTAQIASYAKKSLDLMRGKYNYGESKGRLVQQLSRNMVARSILDGRLPAGSDYAEKVLGYIRAGKLAASEQHVNFLSSRIKDMHRDPEPYLRKVLKYSHPQRLAAAGRRVIQGNQSLTDAMNAFTDEVIG